ncbi:hypothetical protein RQP46_011358 [Phenoliferia psychrophenolica]
MLRSFLPLAFFALFSLTSCTPAAFAVVKRSPDAGEIGAARFAWAGMVKRDEQAKRQTGTTAFVQVGTSNPAATDVNDLGDVDALSGGSDGSMTAFSGKAKRQTGTQPAVEVGTSIPAIAAGETNDLGDVDPLQAAADGSMTSFSGAKVRRAPLPLELNLVSHAFASRGFADGRIEHI